jgi:hypothetical protein
MKTALHNLLGIGVVGCLVAIYRTDEPVARCGWGVFEFLCTYLYTLMCCYNIRVPRKIT